MCTGIAKSGSNVMFPNLAHPRVARNGKMCAQELPKVAIMLCSQIWFILELPAQELPKVAITLSECRMTPSVR